MNVLVGTSGWSYKEWKGSFYPAGLPAGGMLRHYASHFPTVEVNNSFYRLPTERVLAAWAEQVPSGFRFVLKASRRITHFNRLNNQDGSLEYFLRAVNPLGARRGPTLFQLPPAFEKDPGRLREFLARLPRHEPAAFEFRHDSWFDEEIYQLLRDRDVALVAVDEDENEGRGAPLVATAGWGYLRLRRSSYGTPALERWASLIYDQAWRQAYVFLKHEEGSPVGPAPAEALREIVENRS
jgi:uncharacterized protein YecE (DUF72 family)